MTPEACRNMDAILEHRAAKIRELEAENAALLRSVVTLSRERDERAETVNRLQAKGTALLERARRAERLARLWKALARRLRASTDGRHRKAQPAQECSSKPTS